MRTRFMLLTTVLALALAVGGCKKEPKEQPKEEPNKEEPAGKEEPNKEEPAGEVKKGADKVGAAVADIEAFMKDEKAALTPELLEAFVVSLKACELKKFGPDYKCEEYKKYNKARGRRTRIKSFLGMNSKVGAKLIGHENETVRYIAAGLMSSFFGSNSKTQEIIVKAARAEKNPFVLAKMIGVVGSRMKKNEDVKKLLVDMADHEEGHVRRASLTWFTNSFAADVDGVFDIVLKKVDKDPDMEVRTFLCERLYGTGDKRAIKVLKKYVDDKKTDKKLYSSCFRGLVRAWTSVPQPKNPNQEAYQHTLKLLKATPRDKDHPPWMAISSLGWAKEDTKSSFQREWLGKVKGWYKAKTLRKVLADLATDENANWLGRTSAVRVLKDLGASKADMEGLKKKLGKGKNDKFVIKAVDNALKKMK